VVPYCHSKDTGPRAEPRIEGCDPVVVMQHQAMNELVARSSLQAAQAAQIVRVRRGL